jgi:putative phosphoesterase
MRIALISDIHGNLVALEAVLADLQATNADKIICLGDVAVFGPQPREVIARLQALACPVVMGNTDAWLLDPQPWAVKDEDNQKMYEVELWAVKKLTEDDLAFVRSFQPIITVNLDGNNKLLCYHGSPLANTDLLRPSTPEDALAQMLGEHRAAIMAGGHTHQAMLRHFGDGLLINPGSVGLPYIKREETAVNPLWAEYALITIQNRALEITFRRVPFDFSALQSAVEASNMPHAAWWLEDWQAV